VYDNQMGKDENTADATVLGVNGTGGGSIVIHEVKTPTKKGVEKLEPAITVNQLDIRIQNNPSTGASAFRLQIRSNDRVTPISLRVMDGSGRPVESRERLAVGSSVEFGRGYIQGMYFVEVQQGEQRKVLKLMKQ
jgi:hypothetical protein